MTLDPKASFVLSQESKMWKTAVRSSWFEAGLTAAVAHMALTTAPTGNDAAAAAAAFNRMEGAKALVHTMMNLAEVPTPQPTPPNHNLKPV